MGLKGAQAAGQVSGESQGPNPGSAVDTVRYASINAHLVIEQSRRDDIENIGYVLTYIYLGRLPCQSKMDKGKPPVK